MPWFDDERVLVDAGPVVSMYQQRVAIENPRQ